MTSRGAAAERHVPVLRDRVLDLLAPALTKAGAVYVDGTLGMGGHAQAVLDRFPEVTVVGIDRDTEALQLAGERLSSYAGRLHLVHAVYDEVGEVLDDLGHPAYDAALFDLGVSSLQLDEADRGFAYSQDAPLDMRMDQTTGITAAEVLNTYAAHDLERVLRDYGEERFARRIAATVVRERETAPFASSARLVELLRRAVPAASQRTGGNPAKRTFQALRIEVNAELPVWARAVGTAVDRLAVGGRLVVLSYHSLEDRITKRAFAAGLTDSTPAGLPVDLPEHAAYLQALTRGAELADQTEQDANPRSASVRLRAVERIRSTTKGTNR